ncbi:MAG: type II toxin-antitoxin system VapB family antitoxin [Rhodospirillales bacterium]
MPLNLKSAEADRLARELAAATGETITRAVTVALSERLARQRRARRPGLAAELAAIKQRAARLRRRDRRSADAILGYRGDGTFG